MTDTETGPSSVDVFEHAMLSLTKEPHLYNGRVIVGRLAPTPDNDERDSWPIPVPATNVYQLDHDDTYLRCFVGQAIVRAPEFLGYQLHIHRFASYGDIARAYNVPIGLVRIIGDGVNGWAFSTAVKFVRRVLKAYRAGGMEAAWAVPWPHRKGEGRDEDRKWDAP